jgi:hypothetical protein
MQVEPIVKRAVFLLTCLAGCIPCVPSAFAQVQPAVDIPCVVDGPSINDTLIYLNQYASGSHFSYNLANNLLLITTTEDWFYRAWGDPPHPHEDLVTWKLQVQLNRVGCVGNAQNRSPPLVTPPRSVVSLYCSQGANCVTCTSNDDEGKCSGLFIYLNPQDLELAGRIGRATSHLIYLLQQQYKTTHPNEPKDPFAAPSQ